MRRGRFDPELTLPGAGLRCPQGCTSSEGWGDEETVVGRLRAREAVDRPPAACFLRLAVPDGYRVVDMCRAASVGFRTA